MTIILEVSNIVLTLADWVPRLRQDPDTMIQLTKMASNLRPIRLRHKKMPIP